MKVLADRSSSAGPLWGNDEGNTSPVLTFTPAQKQMWTQYMRGHMSWEHCIPHSAAYSSLTNSIYYRPMSSINNNVIHFYKNREQMGWLDESMTGRIFLNNSKQAKAGIKVTCDATCFQMNILFLFLECCYKVKENISKCLKSQMVPAKYYNDVI